MCADCVAENEALIRAEEELRRGPCTCPPFRADDDCPWHGLTN